MLCFLPHSSVDSMFVPPTSLISNRSGQFRDRNYKASSVNRPPGTESPELPQFEAKVHWSQAVKVRQQIVNSNICFTIYIHIDRMVWYIKYTHVHIYYILLIYHLLPQHISHKYRTCRWGSLIISVLSLVSLCPCVSLYLSLCVCLHCWQQVCCKCSCNCCCCCHTTTPHK